MTITVTGKAGEYTLGELINQNSRYSVYRCTNAENRELLVIVGVDNSVTKNEFILRKLKKESDRIEKESGQEYNYDLGFPDIIDSMTNKTNFTIVGFKGVESLESVIPLVKFQKSNMRVDLRTSAWIMGKLLKIVAFAHDLNIKIGKINGNNILIQPDFHYVIVFDWSFATVGQKAVGQRIPSSEVRSEIQAAAQVVIKALGGDLERVIEHETDRQYTSYIKSLATNGAISAQKAHKELYKIIDSLCENPNSVWESGFYKFTSHAV